MRKLRHQNTLIIVTGSPGTGKSTWAKRVADAFAEVKVLAYDDFKLALYDAEGFDDLAGRAALDARALDDFYAALDRQMAQGGGILIEYPFNQRHKDTLEGLVAARGYCAVTLYLHGDMEEIYRRVSARDRGASRHPGFLLNRYHKGVTPPPVEAEPGVKQSLEEFLAFCGKKDYNVRIGAVLDVDVTDLARVDAEAQAVLDRLAALG